jgi:hypothetical protein
MLSVLARVTLAAVLATSVAVRGGESQYVAEKRADTELAIRLLGELSGIAQGHRSHYPDGELQAKIREVLKPLGTVEGLAQFALLSWAVAGSQRAEHQNYDSVFDYAQWACVYRIASIPGEEARTRLDFLRSIIGCDGHPAEEFAELIESQARLPER